MAQFPYLPLFTDAWVADTAHLTYAERGLYLDLLVLMWRTPGCKVPNDDAWLAKHLRLAVEQVAELLRPIIREFCQTDGNHVTQKRLQKEFVRAFQYRGRLSALGKRRKNKKNGASNSRSTEDAHNLYPHPQDKGSSPGESQHDPPGDNPPATEPEPTQQDPSASRRATALPEGAPARSPPTQQDPRFTPTQELINSIAKRGPFT